MKIGDHLNVRPWGADEMKCHVCGCIWGKDAPEFDIPSCSARVRRTDTRATSPSMIQEMIPFGRRYRCTTVHGHQIVFTNRAEAIQFQNRNNGTIMETLD